MMTLWNYDQQPWILEERGGKLASEENTKNTAKFKAKDKRQSKLAGESLIVI